MKKTILAIIAISAVMFVSCFSHQTETSKIPEGNNSTDTAMKMKQYESQIWIDNFISADHKDSLIVKLWSEASNQFINEVPNNDTSWDWWTWYQKELINAVLFIKDIEPLYLDGVYALAQCFPITEGNRRAIVIVPYVAQQSNWVDCTIYSIKNNKWVKYKSFPIAIWDDCGGKESLGKCLVKKNGRWMYADQHDIDMEPKEKPYHMLFE
ncbi:MAG: hypothetical protein IKO98_06935 [Bacteroidales bacterium]|nr:hypothetical protein [Bacteroidales bacterium]